MTLEQPVHDMKGLFEQLGLPDDPESIEEFISTHPLASDQPIDEAPFWNPAQAEFLREELCKDADWAEVIDELNALLHKTSPVTERTRPWGNAIHIRYYWHETSPAPHNCGTGDIYYDAESGRYALYNTFANAERRLGYILDERTGTSHVFEWRDGRLHCSRHPTDRKVLLADQPVRGESAGHGVVPGGEVRFVDFHEPGDHDRWLWCLDQNDQPLRFFTWTHHGQIQVIHDLIELERDASLDDALFEPPGECE